MTIRKTSTRRTLVQKLILSYASMLFFTTAALVFSIVGLYSLNKTAKDIIMTDLPVINATNHLRESLLAQERYAGKFLILKSPVFRDLFHRKEAEFIKILGELGQKNADAHTARLIADYQDYRQRIEALFDSRSGNAPAPDKVITERVFSDIEAISANRQLLLSDKLTEADQREATTVRFTLMLALAGFILALSVAGIFAYNISSAMRKLKKGTHRIAEGDFDFNLQIPPGDEIGDLAEDFARMAKKLKELEQMSLDASPLTRLPGNIAIERLLTHKLGGDAPFAVCYADLDNFKAYNDHYGYIKASDVIKMTGDIICDRVATLAGEDQFIGHVGGDDFVMVVPPDKAAAVCESVIDAFTAMIMQQYSAEDLARGAIEGVDRYGVHRTFPIMTISIAVLICRRGEYASASDIAEAALAIKDRLKGMTGSNYFINRGRGVR